MFSDPQKNISKLRLGDGMSVADLGSGSGHYSLLAARIVGEHGRVYAIDMEEGLLTRLKNEAERENLKNIEVIAGDVESEGGVKLKDASLDRVIASNILFHIEDMPSFCKEVARIVKPGGKVLVVEWMDSFGGLGPHPDHVVKKEKASGAFISAGFTQEEAFDAGSHHYGLVLKK